MRNNLYTFFVSRRYIYTFRSGSHIHARLFVTPWQASVSYSNTRHGRGDIPENLGMQQFPIDSRDQGRCVPGWKAN